MANFQTLPKPDQLCTFGVQELGLVSPHPPEAFDNIARLVMRQFDVPVALVSIVQEHCDRQYFSGMQGLSDPWARFRQTPLSHSFCQHVKRSNTPLIIDDARSNPLVQNNQAIPDLNVIAYLGVPIRHPDGSCLGALCVIQDHPRRWTEDEVELLGDFAKIVNDEITLRASLLLNKRSLERAERFSTLRESIAFAFMAPDMPLEERFEELLRAGCKALRMDHGAIAKNHAGVADLLFSSDSGSTVVTAPFEPSKALFNYVTSGQEIVHFQDVSSSSMKGRKTLRGETPGAYISAPLILRGTVYGAIEFSSRAPRCKPWGPEHLNVFSIIALFTSGHLELFGQIRALKSTEKALSQQLIRTSSPVT